MKKLYSFIMLIVAVLTSTTASAQVSVPADLYGTYTMSYKSNGYDSSMEISIMESDNKSYKKGMLVGFMGAENNMYINQIDYTAHTITIYSPTISFYGSTYYLANENGDFPVALDASGQNFDMVITFDPSTKALTFPTMKMGTVDSWNDKKFTPLTTYSDITATFKEGIKVEDVDWSGTWTVPAGENDHNYGTSTWEYPASFTFKVIEDGGKYYVTEFFGKNIEDITWGGIQLVTNGNKATISSGQLVGKYGEGKEQYIMGNYYAEFVEFEMSNGKITNKNGFIIAEGTDKTNAYFYGAKEYTKAGGTGGGSSDNITYEGTYMISGTNSMLAYNVPGAEDVNTSGAFTITKDGDKYYVDAFLGYDTYSMNNGGMELKIDANDPTKATITCNGATMRLTANLTLADNNGVNNPVEVKFNTDGTVTIGECSIRKDGTSTVGWFKDLCSKLTDGVNDEKVVNVNAAAEIYNVSGMKLSGMKRGINIIRKGGKTFKVNVK